MSFLIQSHAITVRWELLWVETKHLKMVDIAACYISSIEKCFQCMRVLRWVHHHVIVVSSHFLQQNCHFDAFKCFFLDILRNIQEDCELSFWCLEKTSIISCSFILFKIFMLIWYEYEGCLPQLLIVTTNNMWLNPSNIIHLNWIWMQQISNITV